MHRKFAAVLLGTCGLFACAAVPAAGQTAGSGAPALQAEPAADSTVDAVGQYALSLGADEQVNQTLVVRNGTPDRRLTVRILPVDGTRGGDGVRFSSKATETGSGSWLTSTVGVVTLEPGAEASVPFSANAPPDAAPGDNVVAGLRVFAESAKSATGGSARVDDVPVIDVPVTIAVPGAPAPRLSVTSVTSAQKDGAPYLAVKVRNSGSVVTNASGTVKAPGGELTREINVRVEPREEITAMVEWQAIDIVHGADVVVELEYGEGDVATWAGIVPADPEAENIQPIPGEEAAEPTTPTTTEAPKGKGSSTGTFVGYGILALMGVAAIWFIVEFAGGSRTPSTIAIDPASFPTLQVMMDPRHTDVLDALVTQVGALGGAIGTLAEAIGVTVAIPAPPPLLTPSGGRRHRGRPRHAPAEPIATASVAERVAPVSAAPTFVVPPRVSDPMPVPEVSASPTFITPPPLVKDPKPEPAAPSASALSTVRHAISPPPPPAHDVLPKASQQEIAADIQSVTEGIRRPAFYEPPSPQFNDPVEPEERPALPSRHAAAPRGAAHRTPPLPQISPEFEAAWLREPEGDQAFTEFFAGGEEGTGRDFWSGEGEDADS
jgi:hypothetical protein